MTCKAEGDVLQTCYILQKQYIYQIFMWNYPVSKTCLSKIMSPLDARFMAFFNTIE